MFTARYGRLSLATSHDHDHDLLTSSSYVGRTIHQLFERIRNISLIVSDDEVADLVRR